MAGHSATITINSTNQTDSITLTPEAVELLYPGTPQQTVAAIRDEINAELESRARSAVGTILVGWLDANVQVST